jgi:hypothetical protein
VTHILSIKQNFLEKDRGVAVCSCGRGQDVEGPEFGDLLAAGEAWHATHVAQVGGEAVSFTQLTDR